MTTNEYDKKLEKSKIKLKNLEKILVSDKKELLKLQNNLKSAKKRTTIARSKTKSIKSKSIHDRMKLSVKKETGLERAVNQQKQIIKKLQETIASSKKEISGLERQKKSLIQAMSKFEKQWTKFYSKSSVNTGKMNVGSSKQIDFGHHVRAARALLNYSRNDFAKLMEINPELLKQIEKPNKNSIFEPDLVKEIYNKLKKAGIEIIPNGFYVGDGGIGVRLKRLPSKVKLMKTKRSKKSNTVVKLNNRSKPKKRKIAA